MSPSSASMTDLMFLLMFFMLMAMTLINSNALRLTLPKSSNDMNIRPNSSISIDAQLNYYLDRQPIALTDIEAALQAKMANMEEVTVSLHCDKTVPIDDVVKVMNIAKNNRYRLILATDPE